MSKLFRLGWKDLLKGLVVAVLAAVMAMSYEMIRQQGLDLNAQDFNQILSAALSAGLAYLLKNLVTDDQNKLGGRL